MLRGAACAALLVSGSAAASLGSDCVIQVVGPTTISATAGSTASFSLQAAEGTDPFNSCGSASYQVSEVSDSTDVAPGSQLQGPPLGGPVTGGPIGVSSPTQAINVQIANRGGGSVTFNVACTSGCDFSTTPTTVTINVDDVFGASVSAGNGQTAQINTAFPTPLSAQVIRNGANGSSVPVTWEVISGSATFPGGVTTFPDTTDANGLADVAVTAGPTSGPVSIRMTVDGTGTTAMFALTVTNNQLHYDVPASGNASGTVNTAIPLAARFEADGVPQSGKLISYAVISGPSGASVSPTSFTTGADGRAPVDFTATAEGSYVVQATYTPPSGAPITLNFNVQVAINRTLVKPPSSGDGGRGVVGSTIALTARALNDGNPASVSVNWTVLSGPGSFATGSVSTDGSGNAQNPLTLGPGTGAVTVRASRADDATVFTDYTVEAFAFSFNALPAGGSVSGEAGQAIALNVMLEEIGNTTQPLGGHIVDWSVISSTTGNIADGVLSASSSNTASSGIATVNLTPRIPGTYVVRATYNGFSTGSSGAKVTGAAPLSQDFTVVAGTPSSRTLRKPTSQSGDNQSAQPNTVLPLPLRVIAEDNGAAPGQSVLINWAVSGDATLSATQTSTDGSGNSSITVTTGSTPGQATITASRDDVPSATTSFVVTTTGPASEIDLLAVSASNNGVGAPGAQITLQARATRDRLPQPGVEVIWEVIGGDAQLAPPTSITNADGLATTVVTLGNTPGDVQVRATRGDAGVEHVVFALRTTGGAAPSLVKIDGDNQRGAAGQAFAVPLRVAYSVGGNQGAGVAVAWSVVSGSIVLDGASSTTDMNGQASMTGRYGANAGPAIVRAAVGTLHVDFSLQVDPAGSGPRLRIVGGDMQRGLLQTLADAPLEVELTAADGHPIAGAEVLFEVTAGSARFDSPRATTDAAGRARVALRYGDRAGAVVVRASASGATIDFNLTALAPTVASTSGDNQTGPVGQPLAEDFVITLAPAASKALSGIQVNWQVVAGGGTLSSHVTSTDNTGTVRTRLTLGPQPGLNRVRATFVGGGEVLFTATGVVSTAELRVISGNGQAIATNDASDPLVVELRTSNGQLLAGVPIDWTATNGTLAAARTTTDAQGRSQNAVRITMSGAAAITARAVGVDATATFALNGGLANLDDLTPEQRRVSLAIDQLCPALAAQSTRTPEEQDLLARCRELVDNAGDAPDSVRAALDQLPTDVGKTMAGAGLDSIDAQQQNHQSRFETIRQERSGGARNQFNVGLWTPDGALPLSFLPSALAQDEASDAGGSEAGASFDRWGFFATGTIGRGEVDGDLDTPKFDYDIAGLTAGVDYRFSDRLVAGASLGFNRQDTDLDGDSGTLESDGWTLSAYASWFNDRSWYVDGVLSFGSNDYDVARSIRYTIPASGGGTTTIDQRATASTSGDTLGAALSVGRSFARGAWNFDTYLRGNYARADYDRYSERLRAGAGAGLALDVDARELKSMTAVLGGKATYVMSRDWGVLIPQANLELVHEFEDDPSRVVARFLYDPTGTPFELNGADVDADYFNAGVGVSALFPGGRSAYLYYEQLVGASQLSQGILSLGVRFEF